MNQGILDLYKLKREGQDSGNSIEKEVSGEMPMDLRLEALQNCASAAESGPSGRWETQMDGPAP